MREITVPCSKSYVKEEMWAFSLLCLWLCANGGVGYSIPIHLEEPSHHFHDDGQRYHGPPAPLKHDGTVDDTPEVKHLKAEHLATLTEAYAKAPYPHLNHDGTVAELPEVQHSRAHHLAAVAEAYAKAPKGPDPYEHSHKIYKRSSYFAHQGPIYSGHYHGPPAPINHDGTVADTPEVKHAKAIHFAEHAKFSHAQPIHSGGYSHDIHPVQHHFSTHHEEHHNKYHGPPAPLNHDGTVAETPDVIHVKNERLAALAEAYAKAPHDPVPEDGHAHKVWKRSAHYAEQGPAYGHYHGPPAPLNHDGTVADTPEVQAAKSIHFAAHAHVKHVPTPYHVHHHNEDAWHNEVSTPHVEHHRYHGPPAPLNHDGTVAETPEVKHLKNEHLAAVAEAFAKAPRDHHHGQGHSVWKRSIHQSFSLPQTSHYQGPPAPLNHDGTVAETPEVQALKAYHLEAHAKASYTPAPIGYQHQPIYHENHIAPAPIAHGKYQRPLAPVAQVKYQTPLAPVEYDEYEAPPAHSKYQGPPAPLNQDGTVAETPEVQQLKAEHLAAVAEAYANAPKDKEHNEYVQHNAPLAAPIQKPYPHFVPAPLNHGGAVAQAPYQRAHTFG